MNSITRVMAVLALTGWANSATAVLIPWTEIVTADGKDWVQPDLFAPLSWNDINAVCPGGVCVDGGVLNGFDVSDMLWASVDEVNALLNYYIGSTELGPGPDSFAENEAPWADDFFSDGWRPAYDGSHTSFPVVIASGWTSTPVAGEYRAYVGVLRNKLDTLSDDIANTSGNGPRNVGGINSGGGAWLYRSSDHPSAGVPLPATLALFGLGLAGLRWTRYKNTCTGADTDPATEPVLDRLRSRLLMSAWHKPDTRSSLS